MLRYNQEIRLQPSQAGQWSMTTDRGQRWFLQAVQGTDSPLTEWWTRQNQSELRSWQKDAILKELTRNSPAEDTELYVVYAQGQGWNQPHDILIFYFRPLEIWLLSHSEGLWIQPSPQGYSLIFPRSQSVAVDVTSLDQRRGILYPLIDGLRKILRP